MGDEKRRVGSALLADAVEDVQVISLRGIVSVETLPPSQAA